MKGMKNQSINQNEVSGAIEMLSETASEYRGNVAISVRKMVSKAKNKGESEIRHNRRDGHQTSAYDSAARQLSMAREK